jgi:hypothetical protein
MYPSVGTGNARSIGTRQALSSTATINPCFMSLCKWLGIIEEGVQSCSTMTHGGRKGNTFEILVLLAISFFSHSLLFSSLFVFSRHMEKGKERTADDAQGYRGAQGQPPALNPTASVVKRPGPLRRSKGPGKLSLPASPTPHASRQLHQQGIQKSYPPTNPSMVGGAC